MKVIKKNGVLADFDEEKIKNAITKSAERAMIQLSEIEKNNVCNIVYNNITKAEIPVAEVHILVENALDEVNPKVAKSYRDYRNYKLDFVKIMDDVYKKIQSIDFIGDRDNANTDSTLVSTKRCLGWNELNGEFYKKFFLTPEENQAMKDGYIYIHDRSARLDTMNCCLFNIEEVLNGGFELGNIRYTEPTTLAICFNVIGDIIMAAASQQYGLK